jgi:hypothetical protein
MTPDSLFTPRWARKADLPRSDWADSPDTGVEPPYVPRLPTRLLPFSKMHSVSAQTLTDVVWITQRILNCISYELAYGSCDTVDLRSVGEDVLRLARLEIEPFEEGSFLIPGTLTEELIEIKGRELSGADVLQRFSDVMNEIEDGAEFVHASTTVLEAVEDLGRVTRREAHIEYAPQLATPDERGSRPVLVNAGFVSSVARMRKERVDPRGEYGEVEGRLTAVDVRRWSFRLSLGPQHEVRGTFGEFARATLLESLNKQVKIHGVLNYVGGSLRSVRAMLAEAIT